jgi:hypothetical protein
MMHEGVKMKIEILGCIQYHKGKDFFSEAKNLWMLSDLTFVYQLFYVL